MVWGAICEGFGPGLFFIWEKETRAKSKELEHLLQEENKENRDAINA
jgi:hypothetical protein